MHEWQHRVRQDASRCQLLRVPWKSAQVQELVTKGHIKEALGAHWVQDLGDGALLQTAQQLNVLGDSVMYSVRTLT